MLKQTTIILFLSISVTRALGGTCGPKFPEKCSCGNTNYEEIHQYVVNCTDVGLRNTSVLEYMPLETEVLIFTGNNIPELPWNVFGAINDYSSLTIIDMSNNHIREIRGKSYHHVQNVKRLILNHNNLSISRNDDETNHHHPRVFSNFLNLEALHLTDAFSDNTSAELSEDLHDIFVNSNLTKLRKLHLEQNEITSFKDRRVFCDLPSLQDLHLGDNNLKEINFNIFCLPNLRFLDLERNKFEYVSIRDLNYLDELEALQPKGNRTTKLIVDFGLNPFVCDCRLSGFQNWLQKTQVMVRNNGSLICLKDKVHENRVITAQIEKCVDQAPISKPTDGHTITLVFLLVVLIFILFGLVAALVYMSRDKIKYFIVSPVLDNVSKKVHYTTIKDEECPEVHV